MPYLLKPRLHSWDVFAYEPLPNRLRPSDLALGRLSSGQRQPIMRRLLFVFWIFIEKTWDKCLTDHVGLFYNGNIDFRIV